MSPAKLDGAPLGVVIPDPSTPRGPLIGGYILAAAIDRWRVQRGAVPTYDVLVERLRAHRIATGWTQQDVADRIGLSRASIANAEAGRQTVPGDVLLAWVRVLGGEIALLGVEDTAKAVRAVLDALDQLDQGATDGTR